LLVVDDDAAVRLTLGAVLSEAGYSVTLSPDGADAVERITGSDYDVVLTDLRLGGALDGLDVLEHVRQRRPDTVTLLLTGYASVDSAIGALRNGAYDYLQKPCPPEELLATVARAAERRRLTLQVQHQMRSLQTAIDTARELHSALASRLEGTAALLSEREHVLATVCSELRTSLIAISLLLDLVMERVAPELVGYLEQMRSEAQALIDRVNAAVQTTRSESVDLSSLSTPVELGPISLESEPKLASSC
jgi:CheY-like chemotaxis protein